MVACSLNIHKSRKKTSYSKSLNKSLYCPQISPKQKKKNNTCISVFFVNIWK
ncbi:hypothetical protein HanIR_Chr07g0327901 [Helianthus annuus]|nr:hypothetical protein HanIR_Chr07g0327901 [Helianthus annuus]